LSNFDAKLVTKRRLSKNTESIKEKIEKLALVRKYARSENVADFRKFEILRIFSEISPICLSLREIGCSSTRKLLDAPERRARK
jgi:hypothetical protein